MGKSSSLTQNFSKLPEKSNTCILTKLQTGQLNQSIYFSQIFRLSPEQRNPGLSWN